MISVLLCISQSNLASSLRHYFSLEPDFQVIALRSSIASALPIALNLEPDLFLIEASEDNHVVSALNILKEKTLHTSTIILNANYSPADILSYFRSGAYDVIPVQMMAETLDARLRAFSAYFQNRFLDADLTTYHRRISDAALFDVLLADNYFVSSASGHMMQRVKAADFNTEGWHRAVYVCLHSDNMRWPFYFIHELRIIEDYLRTKLSGVFRSVSVVSGNIRLILILQHDSPIGNLNSLCLEIQNFCLRDSAIAGDVVLSFGIGVCGEGMDGLKISARTARYASLVRLSAGNGHIISYDTYFGDRLQPLDFLTLVERKKLADSVAVNELDTCIRVITDIFSTASAAEFIFKATAIVMVLSEVFESSIVAHNELTSSEITALQSMPPFIHSMNDSRQAERELKNWVIRCFRTLDKDRKQTVPARISAAKRYIAENYLREIELRQAAEYVGLSVPYFCSEFHKACGVSFIKYINNLRLERAAELLLISDDKVVEVAAMSGFQDARHFSRSFREKYGMTPSQYRAQNHRETG